MNTLKKLEAAIKDKTGQDEIVKYLIENVTTKELAEGLVDAFYKLDKAKDRTVIRISQSDFDKHFRIIGFKADGTKEQRGSKRWKKEE